MSPNCKGWSGKTALRAIAEERHAGSAYGKEKVDNIHFRKAKEIIHSRYKIELNGVKLFYWAGSVVRAVNPAASQELDRGGVTLSVGLCARQSRLPPDLRRQFAEARTRCEEGQKLTNEIGDGVEKTDRDSLIFIQCNLAHALLFQDHYDEALAIYRQNWVSVPEISANTG